MPSVRKQNVRYNIVQEPYETLDSYFFLREIDVLYKSYVSLSNFVLYLSTHARTLAIGSEFFTPRLLVCFHTWVCSLCNFYLSFFQGVND